MTDETVVTPVVAPEPVTTPDTVEQSATTEVAEFNFDLSKVSIDEMLDLMEMFERQQNGGFSMADAIIAIKMMRKCLVKGSRPLTGADFQAVFNAFLMYATGVNTDSKN